MLSKWNAKLNTKFSQISRTQRHQLLGCYVCAVFLISALVVLEGLLPVRNDLRNFLWLGRDRNMSNFIRPAEETSFLSPPRCGRYPVKILVLVLSSPHNFARREIVRDTWANALLNQNNDIKIAFIMGRYSIDTSIPFYKPPLQYKNIITKEFVDNRIYVESIQYQDIILEDFTDTYLNLTLKTAFALKWAVNNCRQAEYIFKVDDNVFVNHENLISLVDTLPKYRTEITYESLKGYNITAEIDYSFAGQIQHQTERNGEVDSKYFMHPWFYGKMILPTFIRGLGYVFTGSLLIPLYSCLAGGNYVPGEDVMISGICATNRYGLRLTHHPGFWRGPFNMQYFDMCLFKEAVAVHDFKAEMIEEIFKSTQDPIICPKPSSLLTHSMNGTFV